MPCERRLRSACARSRPSFAHYTIDYCPAYTTPCSAGRAVSKSMKRSELAAITAPQGGSHHCQTRLRESPVALAFSPYRRTSRPAGPPGVNAFTSWHSPRRWLRSDATGLPPVRALDRAPPAWLSAHLRDRSRPAGYLRFGMPSALLSLAPLRRRLASVAPASLRRGWVGQGWVEVCPCGRQGSAPCMRNLPH